MSGALVAAAWLGGAPAHAQPGSAPATAAPSDTAAPLAPVPPASLPSVEPSSQHSPSAGASLARCLYLADRNHPDLLAARARLARVRAQLLEAYSAPYMNFWASGGMALAPTVLGNQVYSPNTDVSLTSSLGIAWRAGIDGVLPLWTFGKITNLWDAANANVKVTEAELDVTRDAIRFDVRRAYFGLQLARDALALLAEAQDKVDEAIDKLRKKVTDDEADPVDLLKLQTFASELWCAQKRGREGRSRALAGLRFYTGLQSSTSRTPHSHEQARARSAIQVRGCGEPAIGPTCAWLAPAWRRARRRCA